METLEDFMKFARFILRTGAHCHGLLVPWMGELTMKSDFLEVLNKSNLISLVFEFYTCCDETIQDCGGQLLGFVVNSSDRITRDNINLVHFFLDLAHSLKRKDPLYLRLRRILCQKLCLCEDQMEKLILEGFIIEMLEDLYEGIKEYVASDVVINCDSDSDSYLGDVGVLLSSLMQHKSSDFKREVSIRCASIIDFLDPLLDKDSEDINVNAFVTYLHHLYMFTSFSRMIQNENHMTAIIERRSTRVLKVATRAVKLNLFRLIENFLQYGDMRREFFEKLVLEFNSLLDGIVTGESLILYDRILKLIRKISKNIPREEEECLASKNNDICAMSTLFEIYTENFCSDSNLLILKQSISMADSELRFELLQCVIPQIDRNSSWIIEISRDELAGQSLNCVLAASTSQLNGDLLVKFAGEDGRGIGVLREWLLLQCQGMLAMGNYFETIQEDRRILMPTRGNVKDVEFFIYFGRLLGLSLMHRVQGGFILEPIVVKMLADMEVTLDDIFNLDPVLEESLACVKNGNNFDKSGVDQVQENFINDYFIDLVAEKIANTKKGVDDIFGSERRRTFFGILHTSDLQVVISGDPDDIMIEEWELHTDYANCKRTDVHVGWFWKIVGEFSAEQKRDLLCFWSSVRYLPPGGFRNLGFRPLLHAFQTDDQAADVTSSTCGSQLNLPMYESYDVMEEHLRHILSHCVGFGFK